jgi:hypothetical protein
MNTTHKQAVTRASRRAVVRRLLGKQSILKQGGYDTPSPEVQKLNAEFYGKLAKVVHDHGKWSYLDDPEQGVSLWIEEHGSVEKALRALRAEVVEHLDALVKELTPLAKKIAKSMDA